MRDPAPLPAEKPHGAACRGAAAREQKGQGGTAGPGESIDKQSWLCTRRRVRTGSTKRRATRQPI